MKFLDDNFGCCEMYNFEVEYWLYVFLTAISGKFLRDFLNFSKQVIVFSALLFVKSFRISNIFHWYNKLFVCSWTWILAKFSQNYILLTYAACNITPPKLASRNFIIYWVYYHIFGLIGEMFFWFSDVTQSLTLTNQI